MRKTPKTCKPVHANAGVEAAYRKELQKLVAQMAGSFEYWLTAAYKKHPPRMAALAQDAAPNTPAGRMRKVLDELAARWREKFEEAALRIAEAYLRQSFRATDSAFRRALKEAGWTVNFQMTPAVRDAFTASLAENVGLIKSIPEQYLQKVEGAVMRAYSAGRDLQTLTDEIKGIYPVTHKRAAFIARDQSNKANAVVNRARQLELGITEAIWHHSHAGRNPRESHVKAGKEKRRYNIAEGCFIDGEYIQPGELINCRCTSRAILPI